MSRVAPAGARVERLYAEVRIARHVSHPNVSPVYDVGEIEGHPFSAMFLIFFSIGTILVDLSAPGSHVMINLAHSLLLSGILTLMLARFGLLATMVGLFFAAYGFYTSLGGRVPFRMPIFQE